MNCRICLHDEFETVVDLGTTPKADDFLSLEHLAEPEVYYPLKVVMCVNCHLVQLTYVVPRTELYTAAYPYVSSTTETGVRHYHLMAKDIVSLLDPAPGSLAVDIGSNVGVLAEGFKLAGMNVLGIEPVSTIARMANLRGIETVNEFFSADLARSIVQTRGMASIITGTNVIAHIHDLWDLMNGVDQLLAPKGAFVFEAPYLGDLLVKLEYDTIYHEHLSYLAVKPIQFLCERFGMELFHLEKLRIHGGTMRYHIARKGDYPIDDTVIDTARQEHEIPLLARSFSIRVERHRQELRWLLNDLKRGGGKIAAVSAPAKGMTLLNYCHIGTDLLEFATEKAPLKIGKFTPGMRIPVVADQELLVRQPDYALLLAWNFADEIMANLKQYTGKFIIPIPSPMVVNRDR